MNEQRVFDASSQSFSRQVVIKVSPVPKVIQIVVLVGANFSLRVLSEPRTQALINVPVRSVNGNAAHAIIMFFEKGAHFISSLNCVAFFKRGKTETLCEARHIFN